MLRNKLHCILGFAFLWAFGDGAAINGLLEPMQHREATQETLDLEEQLKAQAGENERYFPKNFGEGMQKNHGPIVLPSLPKDLKELGEQGNAVNNNQDEEIPKESIGFYQEKPNKEPQRLTNGANDDLDLDSDEEIGVDDDKDTLGLQESEEDESEESVHAEENDDLIKVVDSSSVMKEESEENESEEISKDLEESESSQEKAKEENEYEETLEDLEESESSEITEEEEEPIEESEKVEIMKPKRGSGLGVGGIKMKVNNQAVDRDDQIYQRNQYRQAYNSQGNRGQTDGRYDNKINQISVNVQKPYNDRYYDSDANYLRNNDVERQRMGYDERQNVDSQRTSSYLQTQQQNSYPSSQNQPLRERPQGNNRYRQANGRLQSQYSRNGDLDSDRSQYKQTSYKSKGNTQPALNNGRGISAQDWWNAQPNQHRYNQDVYKNQRYTETTTRPPSPSTRWNPYVLDANGRWQLRTTTAPAEATPRWNPYVLDANGRWQLRTTTAKPPITTTRYNPYVLDANGRWQLRTTPKPVTYSAATSHRYSNEHRQRLDNYRVKNQKSNSVQDLYREQENVQTTPRPRVQQYRPVAPTKSWQQQYKPSTTPRDQENRPIDTTRPRVQQYRKPQILQQATGLNNGRPYPENLNVNGVKFQGNPQEEAVIESVREDLREAVEADKAAANPKENAYIVRYNDDGSVRRVPVVAGYFDIDGPSKDQIEGEREDPNRREEQFSDEERKMEDDNEYLEQVVETLRQHPELLDKAIPNEGIDGQEVVDSDYDDIKDIIQTEFQLAEQSEEEEESIPPQRFSSQEMYRSPSKRAIQDERHIRDLYM